MKKQYKKAEETKNILNWKNRRELMSKNIPLEVDLENRQLFFKDGIKEKLHFDFGTNNIDNLIKTYLDPKDLEIVNRSLTQAKKGLEKPIPFNFIHPLTSKSIRFEYRYQIVYVKYASTRLLGELIKIGSKKARKI
ncbi:hypothetical protein [Aurantibacillus circumpalustris]|uniref:hypothetical protein n=1 Tax=Aurantibacillus circumpalustris TaxID=3036359 RepID=UPI00295B5D61|nr:hypothetical protein [Aurantibacillus circumpalustris]